MRSPESSYLPSPIVGQAILRLKVGEEPAPVRRVLATPPSTPTHTHPLAPLISGRAGYSCAPLTAPTPSEPQA